MKKTMLHKKCCVPRTSNIGTEPSMELMKKLSEERGGGRLSQGRAESKSLQFEQRKDLFWKASVLTNPNEKLFACILDSVAH